MKPLIKWTGTKRFQAEEIVKNIPSGDGYCELFLGSGAIFYKILESKIPFDYYILNDINCDVIELHKYLLYTDVNVIITKYTAMWEQLKEDGGKFYYEVRKRFNETRNPSDFLFLNRTCVNGLIRYNSKNEFNSPFHFSRNGISPSNLREIILKHQKLIEGKNIFFKNESFDSFRAFFPNDFVYLDPPYSNSANKIYNTFVTKQQLEDYIRIINCKFALSYNGKTEVEDFEHPFEYQFKTKLLLNNSKSSFNKLFQNKSNSVKEYFYTNY